MSEKSTSINTSDDIERKGLHPVLGSALPASALDLRRLMFSTPLDVLKKLSCHDFARIVKNYNTGHCPNCYGGHQRPCQWCGDTGTVTIEPNG